jgi:hypothetical protein
MSALYRGPGYGDGYGDGDSSGDGTGTGYGDGDGTGYGTGYGYGDGTGYGDGAGNGYGYGYGTGTGFPEHVLCDGVVAIASVAAREQMEGIELDPLLEMAIGSSSTPTVKH